MTTSVGGIYRSFLKRPLDCVLALVSIIILSPVLLLTAILVRTKLGRPVIFRQNRPGLHGAIFTLYKFRTMTNDRDVDGKLLSDDARLTQFGKFLRSTSLDELPELFNILKGDMSLIGPRPLLVHYLSLYDESQKRRHEVRPGLSGLAQVSGRNSVKWEDKFRLDVEYVDSISFVGDLNIMLLTLKKVCIREGINSDNVTTVKPFEGSKEVEPQR